jgi:hypothetical protein
MGCATAVSLVRLAAVPFTPLAALGATNQGVAGSNATWDVRVAEVRVK